LMPESAVVIRLGYSSSAWVDFKAAQLLVDGFVM
jgi:hypothetical protein